jgi:hypothetical protein
MRERLAELVSTGPLGQLLWRPWYDRVSLPLVTSLVFPLSRAWAAADAACAQSEAGGLDGVGFQAAFLKAVGDPARARAPAHNTLRLFAKGRRSYLEAEAAFEDALFAPRAKAPSPDRLASLAEVRDKAAVKFMGQRTLFGLQQVKQRFPPVRFSVDAPGAVMRAQRDRLVDPAAAFAPPGGKTDLRLSHAVPGPRFTRHYLRADGPDGASDVSPGPTRAVVLTPNECVPRAALVIAHGIGMEEDFWGGYSSLTDWLLGQGCAVVLPEGPWHGRRRPHGHHGGRYGGEVVVARGPAGLIDYFGTHVPELGALIGWARDLWSVPVGLIGISLGALSAQMVLAHAGPWGEAMTPDAALLVAPSDDVEQTVFEGALTSGIGATDALAAHGWTPDSIRTLRPVFEPPAGAQPAIDPAAILVALGTQDRVVPFATGVGRCDAWKIPMENRFLREQGHFALSLGLPAQPEPLDRLIGLLAKA